MSHTPSPSFKGRQVCASTSLLAVVLLGGLSLGSGCGSKSAGAACTGLGPEADKLCIETEVCESVQGGDSKCFPPVLIQGSIFDLTSSAAIADARIIAIDPSGAAASSVASSAVDGTYSLRIPSTRNADGSVIAKDYTLRADASGYQSFPGGIRPALPIKVMGTPTDKGLVITSSLTSIGLAALPTASRGVIAGSVDGPIRDGILISGGGSTAISDLNGTFVLFNVTPGAVTVRGYASGVQLNPASTTVPDGGRVEGITLSPSAAPLSTVSGAIQFPSPGNCGTTSVLLVLAETFNTTLERGEVPRGLRAANVAGAYSIANVPDGNYKVLAAFENDSCVRDPSAIGGTAIPSIVVPAAGGVRTVPVTSFKVTGALDVRSPGKDQPEPVQSVTPSFIWADDSSENHYELRVFDSLGTLIYSQLNVPSVSGSADVTAVYPAPPAAPALVPGAYYQFRATSISNGGAPISRTEDLRGVFYLPRP